MVISRNRGLTAATALVALVAMRGSAAPVEDALREAGSEGGRLLLAFATPLAPASMALAESLPARMHEGLPSPVTVVTVDPYDGGEGSDLARRFNLHALPTLVLVDPDGSELERVTQVPRDPRKLLGDLLAGRGPLARMKQAERERPGDLEGALGLGRELLSRGDLAGAAARLERVSREAAVPALQARARYDLALLAIRRGEIDAAKAALASVLAEHRGSAAAEDAEIARAQLLFTQGEVSEAARSLERFRLAHPAHARDAEVAALLARIREAAGAAPGR